MRKGGGEVKTRFREGKRLTEGGMTWRREGEVETGFREEREVG